MFEFFEIVGLLTVGEYSWQQWNLCLLHDLQNGEISPRFKLNWKIRAWQQRRKWNCYRRWWTWWDCRRLVENLLNESFFICKESFLLWNGNWCDWNGWNLFLFWFFEAEKNKLEGQMLQFRQEVGWCHLNVLHTVATLRTCFVCCTCYQICTVKWFCNAF